MIYIGIDPGKTGALAIVRPTGAEVFKFSSWKEHKEQLVKAIWDTQETDPVEDFPNPTRTEHLFAVVEKAQAWPATRKKDGSMGKSQGVASVFAYGGNYGGWQCLLEILDIPREYVHPTQWKSKMGLHRPKLSKAEKKRASIQRAYELFPDLIKVIGKNDGKAEALLLAEFGRRLRA